MAFTAVLKDLPDDLEVRVSQQSLHTHNRPWCWIPSLYFTEGLPYFAVVVLSSIMYKRLGLSNAEIAFYTSWFYLPWVIKPLWSPFVEIFRTRRFWVIAMQLLMGAAFSAVALTLPLQSYLQISLALFWLLAFSSATHDIAADGFYMAALRDGQQAFFVGFRSTFYRVAMITGQGLLVILAGHLEGVSGIRSAWQIVMGLLAVMLAVVAVYHAWILPKETARPGRTASNRAVWREFLAVFASFFRKRQIAVFIAFMLLYRLGEAQLVKIAPLFMLDERASGGLGLTTQQSGFVYGTVGVAALVAGGILGGVLVARHGLKFWIWWMALAINLPDLLYAFMAWRQPESFLMINVLVAVEQFGYGFGFTAYMLYLIYIASGAYRTAHYAIATGFMAAGMMLPGMWSGWLQQQLGYPWFFVWVMLAALPALWIIHRLPLDAEYGRADRGVE